MTELKKSPLIERRRTPRMRPKGTAVIHLPERAWPGRIANLSAGGMAVKTHSEDVSIAGTRVRVDVRLDGRSAEWIRIEARVLRVDLETIVVGFDTVPAVFDALIREELMASLENGHTPGIIVVDPDPVRRAPIVAAFRRAGYSVVEVGSPLEAIVRIGESSYEPRVIAVADTSPNTIAEELRTFMGEHHPRAQLVTIGHDELGTEGADWIGSHDPDNDLRARVRRLLDRAR